MICQFSTMIKGILPMAELTYKEIKNDQYEARIENMLTELPEFCEDFVYGLASAKSASTRYAYLVDIKVFLEYVRNKLPRYGIHDLRDLTLETMDQITPRDLDKYLNYLSHYTSDGRDYVNSENGKLRKIASVSSLYKFFIRRNQLKSNPTIALERPKVKNIQKVVLTDDEVDKLLTDIESGTNLSQAQMRTHEKRKFRDLSIVVLLLSTGMRVSELVGLNVSDIYFDHPDEDEYGNVVYSAKVIRKGGKKDTVVFTEECMYYLRVYMEKERTALLSSAGKAPEDEPAMFISLKGSRMAANSVEHMVSDYSKGSIPLKHITPHKFRKTRGSNLYNATGDIELVRNILGHAEISTTSKHYILDAETKKIGAAYIAAPLHEES